MEKAGEAMKNIHGKLTPEKVDETMYEKPLHLSPTTPAYANNLGCRERLREQNALSEDIVNVITNSVVGDQVDEDDLEAELEELQQEQLDEQMLNTGNVPVSDAVHKMPTVANGESKSLYPFAVSLY